MAYRWTGSRDDAEDLVQDILEKLTSRVEELQQVDKLRPWLVRILYRRYVDLYRRERRSPIDSETNLEPLPSPEYSPVQGAIDPCQPFDRIELQQTLSKALATLHEDQRDVILLHDVEGYSAIEVADILELSVGTVKSRLHRGRNLLKKFLGSGTF